MHGKRMMAMLRRQRQRSIMNSVTIASSLPFWAAYGKKDDPFATNNLILGGSLLGWLVGDELIDQFSGKSGVAKTGANWWSWLAPIGNGATVFFLLKDKQHERFIGGVTDVNDVAVAGGVLDSSRRRDRRGFVRRLQEGQARGDRDARQRHCRRHDRSRRLSTTRANLVLNSHATGGGYAAGATAKIAWIVDTEAVRGALGEDGDVASNDRSMLCQEPTRVGRFKRRRDRQSPSRGHG